MSSSFHILLVDDDPGIRELTTLYLNRHFPEAIIFPAADPLEALKILKQNPMHGAILDVMMPNQSGLEFIKVLKQTYALPVLFVSALGTVEDRLRGFEAGADDYLPKPFDPDELIARLKVLLRVTRPVLASGPYQLIQGEVYQGTQRIPLSATEIMIFSLLLAHQGYPLSRDFISAALPSTPSGRTIDAHIVHLRQKLPLVTIRTHRHIGYSLDKFPESQM